MRKKRRHVLVRVLLPVLVLAGLGAFLVHARHRDSTPPPTAPVAALDPRKPVGHTTSRGSARERPAFPLDLTTRSTTDPRSTWVVVNKTHPIQPLTFRPDISIVRGYQVATSAAQPLTDLLDAGDSAGLGLKIASAFRSYDYQVSVHAQVVASQGATAADKVSARPGYSEHQTGLAVDLITPQDPSCDLEQCFGSTAAGTWLRENAWRFGFLVRYTAGDQAITGYSPEPWHLRYVGLDLAGAMRTGRVDTLEQVFGISGGDYAR